MDIQKQASFLDEKCAGRPTLRAAVESLLAFAGPVNDFLDRPAIARLDVSGDSACDFLGTQIGPYKLMEQIGEGGFGNVYLAEQREPIRRQVALKMIKPGMDSRQVMARFEAERQALALMDHPNIAHVLEGGVSATGRPYFVMDIVKGIPITRYCDEHRLTTRERLSLFIPVCQAVQHAHQKGILHRDLKPSNVLVAAYDGQPVPKVIDFGVAKALGEPLTEHTRQTGFGGIVGTLEYMSPEQAEFNALDVDTRTDIYSLGVLLYELFTGTTPLEKERASKTALEESLRVIREEDPPTPSRRLTDTTEALASVSAQRKMEPKRLTKELRGELDWMVMKCLEKDRNRRYPSASGLVQDIERFLNDEPVDAGPPSSWYKLRKFLRRNRGTVVAASLCVLALLGGILGTSLAMIRTERERLRAEVASDQAKRNLVSSRANLDLAVQAVDQFFTQISGDERLKEHDLRPLRQSLLTSAVDFHQSLLESRGQDELAHTDLAHSHQRLGDLTSEIDVPDRAIGHYRRAIREYEQVLALRPDDLDMQCDLAQCTCKLGQLLTLINESEESDRALRRSVDLLQGVLEREPARIGARQQLADSLGRQAFALSMTRRHGPSQDAWRQAIEQWAVLTNEQPDDVNFASQLAHAHIKLAEVALGENITHWPEALTECETALAIQREAVSRPTSSDFERRVLCAVLRQLATVKRISGQNAEAIALLDESIHVLEQLRETQPTVLSHVHDLAVTYFDLGSCRLLEKNLEAANSAFLMAVELEDKLVTLGPNNALWGSLLARVLVEIGEMELRRDEPAAALEAFDRSVLLLDGILHRESQSKNVYANLPDALVDRGRVLAMLGRFDEAMADCDRAVEMTADQLDRCDNFRLTRAWVRLQGGDFVQAVSEASDALEALADRCDIRFLPPRFVLGAQICSQAAELARDDASRTAEERQRLSATYRADAIAMLNKALDGGLSDPGELDSDEFDALEAMPEFSAIRQRVRGN